MNKRHEGMESKLYENQMKFILIQCSDYVEIVELENIIRVEAYQNYAKVYITTKDMLLSLDCLSHLLNQLPDNFYKCHKSHVVNMNYIQRYYKSGKIEMCDEIQVPIARRKKDEFLEKWEALICC